MVQRRGNASNKGTLLELNANFPIIKELEAKLPQEDRAKLRLLIRMINTTVNKIRQTHEQEAYPCSKNENQEESSIQLQHAIQSFLDQGWSVDHIKKDFISLLGYTEESLPETVTNLLRKKS